MTTDAKELFLEALELQRDERPAFLDASCGGDVALRARVESLLDANEDADVLFGASVRVPAVPAPGTGSRIGAFVLEEQLGEGGFATVWRAVQSHPVRRTVALKILKPGMDSREVVARFEAERQALALMDHPSIAKVFDGGATEHGHPWFAMELVDGPPITEYCARRGLDKAQRLALFLDVCGAVQHAHQKGVIHRDLKPSNVLVHEVDGRARPTVIDFGIAKALTPEVHQGSVMTREGQLIGTPEYMSPEQVDDALDVDTRTDVYSLGVLLYELLSGRLPFERDELRRAGLSEILRIIREVEPPRPSTRVDGGTRLRASQVRGDLDWVVMRCLEKQRERRYDSVAQLASDLARHLEGAPVTAGPPDLAYRARKFLVRHRFAVGTVALVVATLVAAVVVTSAQLRRARRAEADLAVQVERAEVELGRFRAIATFLEEVLLTMDPQFAQGKDTELLAGVLESAARRAGDESGGVPEVEATLRRVVGGAYLAIGHADEAEAQLSRALALREEVLAPDDPELLSSLHELGSYHAQFGRQDEGERLLRRAYEGRRDALGTEHADTLNSGSSLAAVLRGAGELDEAVELLLELERAHLVLHGERHDDTLRVQNTLALIAGERGEFEESARRLRRIAELQIEVQGPTHPETLMAFTNLAAALEDLGQDEEALEILERTQELKRQALPDGHPSLIVGMNNLAGMQSELGREEEAEETYRRALAMLEAAGSSDSRHALIVRSNLAELLHRTDRPDEALAQHRANAEHAERVLGPDDPMTVAMQSGHAWQLARLDRHEDAARILDVVVERAARALPEDNTTLAVARLRLAVALVELDEATAAREQIVLARPVVERAGIQNWVDRADALLRDLDLR